MTLSKNPDNTISICCCDADPCPPPTCVNCAAEPDCPPNFSISGEDLSLTSRWEISANMWPSTAYANAGGCIDFSIAGTVGTMFDDFYIMNYTSPANLKAQLEANLTGSYGGTWTVNLNIGATTFTITSIIGSEVNLDPQGSPEFIFDTCGGVELSNHFIMGTLTQNCSGILATHPLFTSGGLVVNPGVACSTLR